MEFNRYSVLKKNHIGLAVLFLLLWNLTASAQSVIFKNYNVAQYTDENGLPQNSIKSIAPDSQGFIWLATEDGLARFDGRNFYIFNKFNLKISSNRFFLITSALGKTDSEKNGIRQGSRMYAVLDGEGDEFVKIENGRAYRDSAYALTGQQNFLFLRDKNQKSFLTSKLPDNILDISAPNHWVIPGGYGKDSFYLCDTINIEYHADGKKQYRTAFKRNNGWNYFTLDGSLYYFNKNNSISKIGKKITTLKLSGEIVEHPAYKSQKKDINIYWNNASGQVYFYLGKSIYQLDTISNGEIRTKLMLKDFDLHAKNIQTIHLDVKTRTLFLGSITNGLFVIKEKHFESLTSASESNVYYAQTIYDNNSVLTPTGIVLGKDPAKNSLIYNLLPSIRKLNSVDERGLLKDRNGFIWVKAGQHLYQFDLSAKKMIRTLQFPEEIKHLYQGSGDMIWLGMANMGLVVLDPSNSELPWKLVTDKMRITYIHQKTPKTLMLGSTDGLYEYDLDTKRTTLIKETKGIYIKSIFTDSLSRVWFTGAETGLMLYNHETLTKFPMDAKRYMASSHCLIDDGNGFFWIPTNKGLFQIAIKDLLHYAESNTTATENNRQIYYNYFAKNQGFNTNEFNGGCQPCGVKLPNGYISFPSLNGLVWFNPKDTDPQIPAGNIILDNVEVNGKWLAMPSDTILLPSNPRQIKFRFSSPCYGDIYNLHLSYALLSHKKQPEESDWVELKNDDASITFAKLDPGNYTLLLRKSNGFGIDNYSTTRISVIIPPLWHQTWWARLLFTMTLLAAIFLYFNWRIGRVKVQNRLLEKKITERTNDLELSKREVNRQLQMMSRLLTSMTHDIQSPLNYIALTSGNIPQMVEQGQTENLSKVGEVIAATSKGMSDILKDLLEYIKANIHRQSIRSDDINLHNLVENKLTIFKTAIDLKHNTIVNELPEDIMVRSDYQMLAIIVHNLIDNATKYTENGIIRFSASKSKELTEVHISNSGVPVASELVSIFNERLDAETPAPQRGRKAGLGFLIIKEIGALLNVDLHVEQTEITTFSLRFPNTRNT